MNEHMEAMNQVKATLIDLGIKFGPKVLVAILIIFVGIQVARWVGRGLHRMLAKIDLEAGVRELLVRILRALVVALFAMMALQNMGVELLPLLAGLGIASAGIALAMQGVLSNIVAGLLIIFTRPFRVGEYISVVDEEGKVERIDLFSTTLGHPDRSRIIIPNRKIVGEILHNFGAIRQLELKVGVSYDTDTTQAIAAIREVLEANARVLKDPAPVIRVRELADSSVNIDVRPWVKVTDYGAAIGEVNKAVHEVFRARHIVIPFPQREIKIVAAMP